MTGTKGKSGGARKGAGRPADVIRIGRTAFHSGDAVKVFSEYPEWTGLPREAILRVDGVGGRYHICIACDDGETIVIKMNK